MDKPARQRLALNALGDDRMTAKEIFKRVAAELPELAVYRNDIDPVLKLLLDAGDVVREREQRGGRALRVYSARRELEGPIADLDAAFHDGEG